jgi:hypothetical protein
VRYLNVNIIALMFYSTRGFREKAEILRILILGEFGTWPGELKGVERLDFIIASVVEDCFVTPIVTKA